MRVRVPPVQPASAYPDGAWRRGLTQPALTRSFAGSNPAAPARTPSLWTRPRHTGDVALPTFGKRYEGVGGPRKRHVRHRSSATARDKWSGRLAGKPQVVPDAIRGAHLQAHCDCGEHLPAVTGIWHTSLPQKQGPCEFESHRPDHLPLQFRRSTLKHRKRSVELPHKRRGA